MGVPTPIAGRLGWATLPSGRVAGLDAGLLVSAPTEENAGAPGTFKTVTDLRDAELTEADARALHNFARRVAVEIDAPRTPADARAEGEPT
jgi:hypothetical protein